MIEKPTVFNYGDYLALKRRTEWVPVKDRLPEQDGEYLCCYGEHIHIGQMINGHFRHYGETADHLITAWMPLPVPYKEDKE